MDAALQHRIDQREAVVAKIKGILIEALHVRRSPEEIDPDTLFASTTGPENPILSPRRAAMPPASRPRNASRISSAPMAASRGARVAAMAIWVAASAPGAAWPMALAVRRWARRLRWGETGQSWASGQRDGEPMATTSKARSTYSSSRALAGQTQLRRPS